MSGGVLVADQGPTSTRAIVFGAQAEPIAVGQQEFRQIFPEPGHVEHDPEEIWRTEVSTIRLALAKADFARAALACDNATIWQSRRTAPLWARLKQAGHEALIAERSGLLLDPYFSATKIAWILDNVPGARAQAERGELAFGTFDSFLI